MYLRVLQLTVFWLFPRVLEGLGSSKRLVGSISTYPGTYQCPWSRVMAKNPPGRIVLPSTVSLPRFFLCLLGSPYICSYRKFISNCPGSFLIVVALVGWSWGGFTSPSRERPEPDRLDRLSQVLSMTGRLCRLCDRFL